MKNKFKYVITFFISIIIVIISINLFESNNEQKIKGSIELLVSEDSYGYLKECADRFVVDNNKVNIKVKQIKDYKEVTDIAEQIKQYKLTTISQLNRLELEQLYLGNNNLCMDMNKVVETYSKNFSKNRLNQIKLNNKIIGVPLTSRPLALYIREDMLNEYGYHSDDIGTWDDFINIGINIYNKSNGEVRVLNATGKDYEDLVSLLIMQFLDEDKSIDETKMEVENKMQELKDNNILNLEDGNKFLARISSINGMRELMSLDKECEWIAINPPSKEAGTNRFFCSEGDNFVVLSNNSDNEKLVEKFLTYVITNNKYTIKYIKSGKFFSSYLYTYKNREIETEVKNFTRKSPLVVMSNIEEKAPVIKEYDKYINIKMKMLNY